MRERAGAALPRFAEGHAQDMARFSKEGAERPRTLKEEEVRKGNVLDKRSDEDRFGGRGGKLLVEADADLTAVSAPPSASSFVLIDVRVVDRLSPSSSTIVSPSSIVRPVIVDVLDLLLINKALALPLPDGQLALLWLLFALKPPMLLL